MNNFRVNFLFAALVLVSMTSSLQAISVECDFLSLHGWKTIAPADDPYGCILRKVEITSKTEVTSITGSHSSGYSNSHVKGLSIYGKVCSVIPSGFEKFFSGIVVMALTETSMKTVSSEDLKQFPSLVEFWLYNQLVEYIEPQLFRHNPNLKYIGLYYNKIKYIGSNFFNELPKLTLCDLSGNQCGITGTARNANELKKIRQISGKVCSLIETDDEGDEKILVSITDQKTKYYVQNLQFTVYVLRHKLSQLKKISGCVLE